MGKKCIESFEKNSLEMTLEFILKKICESKDESYLYNLIHDEHIHRMIGQITNMFGFAAKQGFLISKDVIEGIVITELMWATWHDYDINRFDKNNGLGYKTKNKLTAIENSYLTFVFRIVPLRVRTQINLERPARPIIKKLKKQKIVKSIIDDYFDKKYVLKYGTWKDEEDENGYLYKEVLYGGIQDLEILSNDIQESRWNNNYGHDFDEIEDNETFNEILNSVNLTDNQIDVLIKIYKDRYTLKEIGEMKGGVKKQTINQIKKNAIKKIRRKYKNI
jgi:predicted DNA binding protein